jgi:DNA modification methylase
MVAFQPSISLLDDFLQEHGYALDTRAYLGEIIVTKKALRTLPRDTIDRIIGDAYNYANPLVKHISAHLESHFLLYLGRVQKNQLKTYIDYERPHDLARFFALITAVHAMNDIDEEEEGGDNDLTPARQTSISTYIDTAVATFKPKLQIALLAFHSKFKEAVMHHRHPRIKDYLTFLYSRLVALNEYRTISLFSLFEQNKALLKKELPPMDFDAFREFCSDHLEEERSKVINVYNVHYLSLLDKPTQSEDLVAMVYLQIDQALFDAFPSKDLFYSYLFRFIQKAYAVIQNHKSLIIRIQNILTDGLNIKWEIYARLTIYAEKFRAETLNGRYYFPVPLCIEVIEHNLDRKLTTAEAAVIRSAFKKFGESSESDGSVPSSFLDDPVVANTVAFFQTARLGFMFIDCFVLTSPEPFPNSSDIAFIQNHNELLVVFVKNRVDPRKMPCPLCGSLHISGNSYPDLGIKSWECKNPLCAARSKTNRGKRFSKRTILMQTARADFSPPNLISKALIKIWRKDIVESWTLDQLYSMLVKFYTFPGDALSAVNAEDQVLFSRVVKEASRSASFMQNTDFLPLDDGTDVPNEYLRFMTDDLFLKQFIAPAPKATETISSDSSPIQFKLESLRPSSLNFVHTDCLSFLSHLPSNSIDHMVTSPPYYNARVYSQWPNLFNYLFDMYRVICASLQALKAGGTFFFNVSDIFDNERIVVKSKLGSKRIPLGAYIILLFQQAGFELLDNILWHKGEPQSNRYKNDGKLTPFYQRPANCYEHMFLFKKPGPLLRNSQDAGHHPLTSNIQKFAPIIKIRKGGVNEYGHTAPFPLLLPTLSIATFTCPGSIVLDPFSGSGTSAITAFKMQRTGIGLEINGEYFDLTKKLISQEPLDAHFLAFK